MKVVILAGGLGTRLSEDTNVRPKPMIEIGGKPIIWHIMKIYSYYGYNDFVILLGYKGYLIKEYFANYFLHQSNVTVNLNDGSFEFLDNSSEPWKVTLLDTGLNTMTGGRINKAKEFIGQESFMLTYGDGLSDINIKKLIEYHKSKGKKVTMTSARPEGRFGSIKIDENDLLSSFQEKPEGDGNWVNAGFFVCEPEVFDYIEDSDSIVFEEDPISKLVKNKQICAYKHYGFWSPMDTLRDKIKLNKMYENEKAPWIIWNK